MSAAAARFTHTMWAALGGASTDLRRVDFRTGGDLPSAFAVTDFAAAAMACAALAVDELVALAHPAASRTPAGAQDHAAAPSVSSLPPSPEIRVVIDRRLASFWFATSLRPIGWQVPALRDPLTGDYATRDGWIRLHANAPHHRAATRRVLGPVADRAETATAVAAWSGIDLEQAIVAAGGCAAEMRDDAAWRDHPQGQAVAAEPPVIIETRAAPMPPGWPLLTLDPARPLQGIRVLDLTRVLAGPVATRFLAGLGATVLRIDPPDWDEPGAVPDVTLGKRCARLDLKTPRDHAILTALLASADVLVHGLRPGALDALGFDAATRARLAPGLVDVSLDAYGWSGPWAGRRGFDSLVQMSCGIAAAGMRWRGAAAPVPLPVQALDHATGYWMAGAAIRGLTRRITERVATRSRLSLARTAQVLLDGGRSANAGPLQAETAFDLDPNVEATAWGNAHRIKTPWRMAGIATHWPLPASALGSARATWT
jgi:hypothetical protein